MKEIDYKEVIHILALIVLSFILGALFLRIETLEENMNRDIPNQVHALVEVTVRDTIQEEFQRQELKWNVFLMQ